ncbi:MAG: ATP-binding protein [Acidimicrobiia bacterium]
MTTPIRQSSSPSDLSTNAVVHASSPFRVVVELDGDLVRIKVTDENPYLLELAPSPPPRIGGGSGLRIVYEISERWGSEVDQGTKTVWAETRI